MPSPAPSAPLALLASCRSSLCGSGFQCDSRDRRDTAGSYARLRCTPHAPLVSARHSRVASWCNRVAAAARRFWVEHVLCLIPAAAARPFVSITTHQNRRQFRGLRLPQVRCRTLVTRVQSLHGKSSRTLLFCRSKRCASAKTSWLDYPLSNTLMFASFRVADAIAFAALACKGADADRHESASS